MRDGVSEGAQHSNRRHTNCWCQDQQLKWPQIVDLLAQLFVQSLHITFFLRFRDYKNTRPRYRAAFRSFLESEFSEENIDFWLACEDFKSSSDNLKWRAEEIYEEFVKPTACREINVDHRVREKIQESLEKPSHCCFDEAQKHVYLLMLRDSCPRFLHSDAYLSLKRSSNSFTP
uniref:Regulator of G protein signaling 1 n=1 Tax=Xiphophorus couchianus TaxID=32473 RepID=A0A3B5L6Z5_9TELE